MKILAQGLHETLELEGVHGISYSNFSILLRRGRDLPKGEKICW